MASAPWPSLRGALLRRVIYTMMMSCRRMERGDSGKCRGKLLYFCPNTRALQKSPSSLPCLRSNFSP